MRTVAANVQNLIGWNRSMAIALERAEKGSPNEDSYFIEKLCKTAAVLGYSLTPCKKHKTVADDAFTKAIKAGRLSRNIEDSKYVGNYMFMGTTNGKDLFKNINTRAYDV